MEKKTINFIFLTYFLIYLIVSAIIAIVLGMIAFDLRFSSEDIGRGVLLNLIVFFLGSIGVEIVSLNIFFHSYEIGGWPDSAKQKKLNKLRIRILTEPQQFPELYLRLKKRFWQKWIYFLSFSLIECILLYFIKQYNFRDYDFKIHRHYTTTSWMLIAVVILISIDIIIEFLVLRKAYNKYGCPSP